ncbi:MAG: J domain-containing protein [Rhizobiaceae bacterium]|nr:J domain-containing protein [Rhizobiaceae bacterium]
MNTNSKYFDSIRITKGKKKKPQASARQTTSEVCQWDGCEKPGTHKAPLGRDMEGKYLSFCIDHVREYNKGYNYFSGLGDDDIKKFQKDALTGHRPTWTMGVNKDGKKNPYSEGDPRAAIADRVIQRSMRRTGQLHGSGAPARKLKALEKKAFDDLGIPHSATPDDIKKHYKALVKRHHPDMNGGDRSAEVRLAQIIKSYKILKQGGFCA